MIVYLGTHVTMATYWVSITNTISVGNRFMRIPMPLLKAITYPVQLKMKLSCYNIYCRRYE